MRLLALSLVLALVACNGKSKPTTTPAPAPEPGPGVADPNPPGPNPGGPKPTPSDAELEVLFARTLDFFDELAPAVEAAGTDCKKMAAEMDRVFTKHDAFLDEVKGLKGNAEVDAKADAYMEQHKDRLAAAVGKMGPGMQACESDPDVELVMKRFEDL